MSLEDVQDANGNFNGWTDRWFWIEQSRVFANDSLTIASNSFSKDWDPIRFKSGLNQSFNFSVGNKYVLNLAKKLDLIHRLVTIKDTHFMKMLNLVDSNKPE